MAREAPRGTSPRRRALLLAALALAAVPGASTLVPCPSMQAASAGPPPTRSVLITGGNKGQGLALCTRVLAERDDTRVFLCSRDPGRGEAAAARLRSRLPGAAGRVEVVPLDVTSDSSVCYARDLVERSLGGARLHGVVSNAGVMWGKSRKELMEVCARGVQRVLDTFTPLTSEQGKVVVVSSGLGPLMHGYAVSSLLSLGEIPHPCECRCRTVQGGAD